MNAERRLIEYTRWLQEPGVNYMPDAGTLGRVRTEGTNAGRRTDTQSDGGMGAMVDRMAYAIEQDCRCREVRDLIARMPEDMLSFVKSTYIGHWRDVPRQGKAAAQIMGVSMPTYWRRKVIVMRWLSDKLDIFVTHRKAA